MEKSVQTLAPNGHKLTAKHLEAALGSAALEGLKPDEPTMADLENLVAGNLSMEEYLNRGKARYAGL